MRGIVEVEREVADLLHELLELGIGLVDAAKLDDALAHVGRELIAQRPPRHADNGKLLRQQPILLEVEERRQQLALGQVARGAKDDHDDRIGNSFTAARNLGKILRLNLHLNRRHCLTS